MNSTGHIWALSSLLILVALMPSALGKDGVTVSQKSETDAAILAERKRKCDCLAVTGVTSEATDRTKEIAFASLGCGRFTDDPPTLPNK